jgi:hypothetical protein
MFYREIIAVCSEIHTKHIHTICVWNMGEWGKALCILRVDIILYRDEYPASSPDRFILVARVPFSYWIGGLVNYRIP